ncbi:MAG TPA: tetratricopeptide repeat protein [Candidatus Ozemobacteraceae bacterium]|nr:tetratricopeptide repeat protein [Candidatus Ozemobacteraceae bacterium]HQG28734.1 tetratricopeptide repeat protein [Candidatus Ozemobacteraceae bacterium]
MPRFFASNALLPALFACAAVAAEGGELTSSLRTASELYRTGRTDAAREEALSFQRYFPDNVEALVLLGLIEFEAGRYSDSKQWFRSASLKAPRHPVVRRYRKLLDELEYRNGPFDIFPLPLPGHDEGETAKRFRKAWFGPVPAASVGEIRPPGLEPVLSRDPLWVSETAAPQELPGGGSSGEEYETAGGAALKEAFYLKSYIMYSQAVARQPDHGPSRLGLARAAIQMGKFGEALDVLSPLLSIGAPSESAAEARALAAMAQSLIDSGGHSH